MNNQNTTTIELPNDERGARNDPPMDLASEMYARSDRVNTTVNENVLNAVKTFVSDLSNVTDNEDFRRYSLIVSHVTISKVKSSLKLIEGFKKFFDRNHHQLKNDVELEGLEEPNLAFDVGDRSVSFNFEAVFRQVDQCDREVILDHLNHIWDVMQTSGDDPEESYVTDLFTRVKSGLSSYDSEASSDQMMILSRDILHHVVNDSHFKTLNPSKIVKIMCGRLKSLLSNGNDGSPILSKCLSIIEAVEAIDFDNFNPVQFMQFVASFGSGFAEEEDGGFDISTLVRSIGSLNVSSP